jgi:hypothetical protein
MTHPLAPFAAYSQHVASSDSGQMVDASAVWKRFSDHNLWVKVAPIGELKLGAKARRRASSNIPVINTPADCASNTSPPAEQREQGVNGNGLKVLTTRRGLRASVILWKCPHSAK